MAERNSDGKSLNQKVQHHPDGSKEYWRDVPGYAGIYRVSDLGRVKSLTRYYDKGSRWGAKMRTRIQGRVMVQRVERNGRLSVAFTKTPGGKVKRFLVYRLVLEAFVGPCPEGMEACHFPDRDLRNNRLSNLRWGTKRDNQDDRKIHGTTGIGEKNPSARLTEPQVIEIRRLAAAGGRFADLGRKFGVTSAMIYRIVHRVAWKHI